MKTRILMLGLLLALLAVGGVELGNSPAAHAATVCNSGFDQAADPVQPGTGKNDYYGPYWNGHTNVYVRMQGYDCSYFPTNCGEYCWQVQAGTTLVNGQFGYTAQYYYTQIEGQDECGTNGWSIDMTSADYSWLTTPAQGLFQECGGAGHNYRVVSEHQFQWSSSYPKVTTCFVGYPPANNMAKTGC